MADSKGISSLANTFAMTSEMLSDLAEFTDENNTAEEVESGLVKSGTGLMTTTEYEGDIWLDGFDWLNFRQSNKYEDVKFIVCDSDYDTVSDRKLAGNSNNNYIMANDKGAQMWGGFGGNDYLYGGDGNDTFWFVKGTGYTRVVDCGENDIVNLFGVSLEDFNSLEINSDSKSISATTTVGDEISVYCLGDSVTFQLGDGSRWKYNHSDGSWQGA